MKTTELKVGATYELESGQRATVRHILGRGRNRQVVAFRPGQPLLFSPIVRFAANVVRCLSASSAKSAVKIRRKES